MVRPFPGTRIIPAGSIVLKNVQTHCDEGAFAGVSTEMKLLDAVQAGRFD
jgi:2-keto-3-deoxy-6-phosphogluconate aldolase